MQIDAVITWVDGHDPAHQNKLAHYLASIGKPPSQSAAPTRFNQCGELEYCVKSLLRFAPWIRTIFIVTDHQTPPIVHEKIKVIDHRDIFKGLETALPTFNSLAIESVLWRIKGLSNQFIYLNDDCALLRPVTPDDFFRDDKLVLRGRWKTKWQQYFRMRAKSEHRKLQERSAAVAGWRNKLFYLPHVPLPLHRQTFERFFLEHPECLSQNVHHPLRSADQFWPISLAQHLEIKHDNVVFDNHLEAISIHGAHHNLKKIQSRLQRAEKENVAFICIQSLDLAPKSTQRAVFDWLAQRIF